MAQSMSGNNNQSSRNTILGVVAVVVILIALGFIIHTYRENTVHVTKSLNLPPGSSPKSAWALAQKKGGQGNAAAEQKAPMGTSVEPNGVGH